MEKLRRCKVNGHAAIFHRWADKAEVLKAGFAIGSGSGGQLWLVVGIVEYEDGTVHECYPHEIVFTDKADEGEAGK